MVEYLLAVCVQQLLLVKKKKTRRKSVGVALYHPLWFPDQRERKKSIQKGWETGKVAKEKIEKRTRLSVNESRREEKMRLRGRKG